MYYDIQQYDLVRLGDCINIFKECKHLTPFPATSNTSIGQSITKLSSTVQVFAFVLKHFKKLSNE